MYTWIKNRNIEIKKLNHVDYWDTPEHRRHPSLELKLSIIRRCFQEGEEIKSVSKETDYSGASIYLWRRKYVVGGASSLVSKKKHLPRGKIITDMSGHDSRQEDNMVTKKAAYVVLGVNENGYKEILGIWIGENETAKFWLSVLTDLKNRGVKDILIICSDGLPGIKQAIESAFPNTVQQRCIVHLIRNSCKYLSYKDRKEFCKDLRTVYTASTGDKALEALDKCKGKWGDKYPYAFKPWEDNWNEVCNMFNYVPELRKIMYTTNAIESLNSAFRKFTKIRTVFPTDESLFKSLYLAQDKITSKWNVPYGNWGIIYSSLQIIFEGRL